MIDRALFFANIRVAFGHLVQEQVDGFTLILDEWEARHANEDIRWLAYMLATAWWETGKRMQPIREVGRGHGRKYGTTFYGRGYVQLTWEENYSKMGNLLNLPLVQDPDLALVPRHAIRILFEGMLRGKSGVGDFTHKSLDQYFNATTDDPVGARHIINGSDEAAIIAGFHRKFLHALKGAKRSGLVVVKKGAPANDNPPPKMSWLAVLVNAFFRKG
jgi:putative chitinase